MPKTGNQIKQLQVGPFPTSGPPTIYGYPTETFTLTEAGVWSKPKNYEANTNQGPLTGTQWNVSTIALRAYIRYDCRYELNVTELRTIFKKEIEELENKRIQVEAEKPETETKRTRIEKRLPFLELEAARLQNAREAKELQEAGEAGKALAGIQSEQHEIVGKQEALKAEIEAQKAEVSEINRELISIQASIHTIKAEVAGLNREIETYIKETLESRVQETRGALQVSLLLKTLGGKVIYGELKPSSIVMTGISAPFETEGQNKYGIEAFFQIEYLETVQLFTPLVIMPGDTITGIITFSGPENQKLATTGELDIAVAEMNLNYELEPEIF